MWTSQQEQILLLLSQKCYRMSEFHNKKFNQLDKQLKYFKIPVIVISGINSVIAVGLQEYLDQSIISATNCILALICGIVGSIELYLKISDKRVIELENSRNFYLLHIKIKKEIALLPKHRTVSGEEFLTNVFRKYLKILTNSSIQYIEQHNFLENLVIEATEKKYDRTQVGIEMVKLESIPE